MSTTTTPKNSLAKAETPKFSNYLTQAGVKAMIMNTIKDHKGFISAITSAVGANPELAKCDHSSILSAALLGASLNLTPSPQLGQYYMVPYNDKKSNTKKAQFQLGYKGYIQLAIRSGYYKKLNVLEIKEGEFINYNPLTEEFSAKIITDEEQRAQMPTVGYYAFFEYHNGFVKNMYWSKTKMEQHADKYSPAFNLQSYRRLLEGKIPEAEMWKYSSFWYKSFDDMGKKTMLRHLIGKWGIMSIEFQKAYEADDNAVTAEGHVEILDADVIGDKLEAVKGAQVEEGYPTNTPETEEEDPLK